MPTTWRRRSRYTQAKFRPYTKAIGEFALAWNDFHEALGNLFVQAMGGTPPAGIQISAVWGEITSDRQKRLMLGAAINWIGRDRHLAAPNIAKHVLWLVERGNSLETKRNNVIHSPLGELVNALAAALHGLPLGSITPQSYHFNVRSQNLRASLGKSRKLLTEIRFYRDYATALAAYARELSEAWTTNRALPETPRLPPLKDRA